MALTLSGAPPNYFFLAVSTQQFSRTPNIMFKHWQNSNIPSRSTSFGDGAHFLTLPFLGAPFRGLFNNA